MHFTCEGPGWIMPIVARDREDAVQFIARFLGAKGWVAERDAYLLQTPWTTLRITILQDDS